MSKCIFAFLIIYSQIFCTAVNAKRKLIIHGTPARHNQIPFIVSIQYRHHDFHFCGGSLITWRHILTAAHCVTSPKKYGHGHTISNPLDLQVQAGDLSITGIGSIDRTDRYPSDITVHEEFILKTVKNDIAIITLGVGFPEHPHINLIEMSSSTPEDETKCFIAGWGATDVKVVPEYRLLRADVEIKNWDECNAEQSYNGKLPNNTICAGAIGHHLLSETHVEDACQGDSGGPLICNGKLTGVVSFGIGCGVAKFPGVYTDVSKFRVWIDNILLDDMLNLRSGEINSGHNRFSKFYVAWTVFIVMLYCNL